MGVDYGHYYMTGEVKTNSRGKRKKMEKLEEKLAFSISKYMKDNFKILVWRFDVGADLKLEIGSAVKNKRLQMEKRGYPDLFIPYGNEVHHGLYIELKKSRDEVFKKNGEYRENKHLIEQMKMHETLKDLDYRVDFCWSLEMFIDILKDHIGDDFEDLKRL